MIGEHEGNRRNLLRVAAHVDAPTQPLGTTYSTTHPPPTQVRHPVLNPTFDHTEGGHPTPTPNAQQPLPSLTPAAAPDHPTRGARSPQEPTEQTDPDPEQRDGDETTFMQHTQLDDSVASSSHGGQPPRRSQPRRLPNAAAMVRHWLRELAALLGQRRTGDNLPLQLEQAAQAVGRDHEAGQACENSSYDGGPTKKRRIMNSLTVARLRLQDLTEEDDMDGLNQHQIRRDLEQAAYDLTVGDKLLQYATRNQWGYQLQQGCQGLAQAQAAVQTALAATVEGDLDWHVSGWGQAVVFLLEDAEQLLEEEGQLDFVHPADVAALSEGAQEAPPQPLGDWGQQLDMLLRNIRGVMQFVAEGHEEVRQLMAAIQVWRAAERPEDIVEVDTQTTDGQEGQAQPAAPTPWCPALDADQWSGSVPTSAHEGETQTSEPGFPTDSDLLDALEEYERQERGEAMEAARAEELEQPPEGDSDSAASHRRRRVQAAVH